jgi:hypothetical protein
LHARHGRLNDRQRCADELLQGHLSGHAKSAGLKQLRSFSYSAALRG